MTEIRRNRVVDSEADGSLSGSVTHSTSGNIDSEEVRSERITEQGLPDHPALIRIGGSMTHNLGNYQSARVDVSVELPCGTTDAELRACYERARGMVDDFIAEETDALELQ